MTSGSTSDKEGQVRDDPTWPLREGQVDGFVTCADHSYTFWMTVRLRLSDFRQGFGVAFFQLVAEARACFVSPPMHSAMKLGRNHVFLPRTKGRPSRVLPIILCTRTSTIGGFSLISQQRKGSKEHATRFNLRVSFPSNPVIPRKAIIVIGSGSS